MAQSGASTTPTLTAGQQTRMVGAFMFGHFTHHVTNTLLAPLQPWIRDSFGLSYTQAGLLASAYSVSAGLSQAPIGMLADRIGARRVVTIGLVATGVVCFAIGLTVNYWQLLILLLGLGIVAGTYHAPAASVLAQGFSEQRRGGALGMHNMGGHLSFFATPLVAVGLATATDSWRTPYLAVAILPLVAGLALMAGLRYLPAPTRRGSSVAQIFRELGGVFRVVGPLLSLVVFFQLFHAAILAFLALYLVDAREFDRPTAGLLVAMPSIASLAGSPIGGFLSDRTGRKPVIVTSLVCIGPLLFALTSAPTWTLIGVLFLLGLATSIRMPVVDGLLLDRAPPERRATTLGAYYLIGQELGGLAAPFLGAVAGVVGIGQAFALVAYLALAGSVSVFALQRRL